MTFLNMFRQPYLDEDNGANLGGGGTPTPEPTPGLEPIPTPQGVSEPAPEPQQFIKVKFNHQEMQLPYEEAVTHIQKGMNYEKAVERAKQDARDAYIAEQGYEWNGKPITTEAEYKQALKEQEIFKRYQAQGLPEDVVQELVESKRFREETLAEKKAREEAEQKTAQEKDTESRRNNMYKEFLEEFQDFNTEDKWKAIPPEIFAEGEKWINSGGKEGRRLSDGVARYLYNKNLSQQQSIAANQANAASSTGSVKGHGLPDSGYISKEVYEANKGNQNWMSKNYDNLMKSMRKWGK